MIEKKTCWTAETEIRGDNKVFFEPLTKMHIPEFENVRVSKYGLRILCESRHVKVCAFVICACMMVGSMEMMVLCLAAA